MKQIKLTEESINKILEGIKNTLTKTSYSGTKITYTVEPEIDTASVRPKARIIMEAKAYYKMQELVDQCSDEVGWHCLAVREEPIEDTEIFSIKDVVVFPQVVTAATVTPDETEYALWLASQPDEIFNQIRFHGHSHVRMGTSPSSTDTTYQESVLQQVNDFYIFGIFNKSDSKHLVIYDVLNNVIYEDKDIEVVTPETPYKRWAEEMLKLHVTKKTYTQTTFVQPVKTKNQVEKFKRKWNATTRSWEYDWSEYKQETEDEYYESVNDGEAFYGTIAKKSTYFNDYKGMYCVKEKGYYLDPAKRGRKPNGGYNYARQK